jgi:hypothetical protein
LFHLSSSIFFYGDDAKRFLKICKALWLYGVNHGSI